MKLRLLECMGWPAPRALRLVGATALALGLALGLPGCGPGTGGTGTGYPLNTAQAGSALSVQGSWSSVASAVVSTDATPPGCVAPTCTAQALAPSASMAGVVLDLADSAIRVNAGCWAFSYDGPWRDAASGTLRVTGLYTVPAGTGGAATQTADLLIDMRDPDIVLTVLDARGLVLQGPVILMRSPVGAEARPVPAGCAAPEGALVKG